MTNSVREEALDWWKEALYNLKQTKKIFEIKEFNVSSFLSQSPQMIGKN
jgi:HEPN domain-containing protein